jgi:3-hydroxyisobutyrate dehydrogenase-like beta-hydroxyacid dehydrogenase
MAKLGFVGLGEMGSRIARRLLDAGHQVTGYNRTRAKCRDLLESGMRWGDSPRVVALEADIIFSMVTDDAALRAIAEGPQGILSALDPSKVYCDMSTVSPATSRAIAAQVAERGAQMLDIPISGAQITVEEGKATMMAGGDLDTFERIKPILLAIGPKATYVGGNGLALAMKIATNLSLAVQMLAFSEGVLLAEKSGIPREVAVEVLTNSVIASPMVKYRCPLILQNPLPAWFDVNKMQKDMLFALELGRQLDVPLPTTSVANQMLTSARAMGLGDYDFAVMFTALARMSGLEEELLPPPDSQA